jgi:hypothetical protein
MTTLADFTDEDFRRTMIRTIRLVGWLTLALVPLVWWKAGWRSVAMLLVGAAISASGLWEWLRLMSAVTERMDSGQEARPVAPVLVWFFLRLGLVVAALYVSLKYLDGSVYAVAAGLGLGVLALGYEGLRLAKAWTI